MEKKSRLVFIFAAFGLASALLLIRAQTWAGSHAGLQLDDFKSPSSPAAGKLGFGLTLGDPSGVTAKYWFDPSQAFNFSLGSPLSSSGIGFYADYCRHLYAFKQAPRLPLYVGGGAMLSGNTEETFFGLRALFGITYLFREPFDVFFELDPYFLLTPEIKVGLSIALGARIYFSW
jgi:hypothetical protein